MNGQGYSAEPDAVCGECGCACAPDAPDIPLGGKPDPCLGVIPGVIHACCGHGDPSKAYVSLANAAPGSPAWSHDTLRLAGEDALAFFELVKRGEIAPAGGWVEGDDGVLLPILNA